MATNTNKLPRLADRKMFLLAAAAFPLIVLAGYFRTYYFSAFFNVPAVPNMLVHVHAIVMSAWVIYFVSQVALARTKNIKVHMTLGMVGVALAAMVVIAGMATAYDSQLVRHQAPGGLDPHVFFIVPVTGMALFILFFGGAIYYRRRPAEHKTLMLMTAINFLPPALARFPLPGEIIPVFEFVAAGGLAITCLIWHSRKHHKVNRVFLAAVILYIAVFPLRMAFAQTAAWHWFTNWLAGS